MKTLVLLWTLVWLSGCELFAHHQYTQRCPDASIVTYIIAGAWTRADAVRMAAVDCGAESAASL